jgi:hypothetical protein
VHNDQIEQLQRGMKITKHGVEIISASVDELIGEIKVNKVLK